MYVSLSVGAWRANGNPMILMKFCKHIHTCPRKVLVQVLSPPSPPGPEQPEILKADGRIFENCLQNKGCSAGCKLTRAARGISQLVKL